MIVLNKFKLPDESHNTLNTGFPLFYYPKHVFLLLLANEIFSCNTLTHSSSITRIYSQ